ncbi:MAG: nitroreductase [Candidatus Lokiarchaeota archaeon]|nr:nitroreductase [Candidatus Lokiarchaeota archaeon]
MDVYDAIKNRRSIRKYKPDPVPLDVITRVLDAARLAPTWANMQGIRYVVVTGKEQVARVADATGQKWVKKDAPPPAFIVAISDPKWSGNRPDSKGDLAYFMLDVGIAFEHLVLAATAEGLGTCWIGFFDEEALRDVLGIKGTNRVVALTPIGYPAESPAPRARKPLSEIAFLDTIGTKLP